MDTIQWPTLMLIAMLVGLLAGQVNAQRRPQVDIPGTRLTGIYMPFNESQYLNVDTEMEAFLGIPFAEPPVEDLRFKNPVKRVLPGTYLAISDGAVCPQISPIDGIPVVGRSVDEDCLYLSVHTSSPRPSNAAVVVWFHGGGYTIGAGSSPFYEPLPLIALSPDIVFVNANYRLGVYGFITTGDGASVGNYGMYDQVMALRWVQDNIAGDDDLYEEWKLLYAEWKNVYMPEWSEAFEDYKDNSDCSEP